MSYYCISNRARVYHSFSTGRGLSAYGFIALFHLWLMDSSHDMVAWPVDGAIVNGHLGLSCPLRSIAPETKVRIHLLAGGGQVIVLLLCFIFGLLTIVTTCLRII